MSDVWQRLDAWLTDDRPTGAWRRSARYAMHRVVESYRNVHVDIDPVALMKLVDAAYPFGERAMHPYKAWLAERKILRGVLGLIEGEAVLPQPTDEDYAACEVAIDLSEQGDDAAAVRLLDEQAPRRLNRPCPVCGAKVGANCVSAPGLVVAVPHLSRVDPSRVNGPLFGGAE